ncbi:dihydrodipicolinate synthase family protein [Coprothermobacter platensis]|uniref:dihydrodipicolinate synthase family protein n=1 Tax=Coprothermobacter platensis TaxID=108819 RepID=UPI00035E46D6|nr:dihydrodipicolinate synthase family protein [Coprothermobacter platensis]
MFRGIIVPLVTSFSNDFSVDFQSMRTHIQYLLSQGVNGIFVNASTSEFFSMSADEQISVMKLATEELSDSGAAVLTGVTSNSTSHSVKLAKMARDLNFDGIVAAPPYYGTFSEKAMFQHFKSIAQASQLPLILYDIPGATGNPLPPSLVEELVKEGLATGIKITRDSLTYIQQILAIKERYPSFSVLVGFDQYLATNLLLGGDGGIVAGANVIPSVYLALIRAYEQSDMEAFTNFARQIGVFSMIYDKTNSFAGAIKAAAQWFQLPISLKCRPPLIADAPEQVEEVLLRAELIK